MRIQSVSQVMSSNHLAVTVLMDRHGSLSCCVFFSLSVFLSPLSVSLSISLPLSALHQTLSYTGQYTDPTAV